MCDSWRRYCWVVSCDGDDDVDVDNTETVRRPSRVCFDLPSHSSSPAAAAYKPASPAAWESRTRPVTSAAPAAPAAAAGSSSVTPTDAQPSCVQQQPVLCWSLIPDSFRPSSSSLLLLSSSVLFLSHPQFEGWPHHGRTFSIYLYPLSF